MSARTIALVIARGGSANPPRKNLLPVGGVPSVQRVTEQMVNLGYTTVISSDDAVILDVGQRAGALVINRPPELATATSDVKYTIKHAVDSMRAWGWPVEEILLREGNTIVFDEAMFQRSLDLLRTGADGVYAVARVKSLHHPFDVCRRDDKGMLDLAFARATPGNHQQRGEKLWHLWGGPESFRTDNFDRYHDRDKYWHMGECVAGLEVNEWDAVHIDSLQDLELAEFLLGRGKR